MLGALDRLWVRLTLGIFLSAWVAVFTAFWISGEVLFTIGNLREPLIADLNAPDGWTTELSQFYEDNESWTDVETFILASERRVQLELFWAVEALEFALQNPDGDTLYSTYRLAGPLRERFPEVFHREPIRHNNEIVGYIVVYDVYIDDEMNEEQAAFTEGVTFRNDLILAGNFLITALGVSMLLSRWLTNPLRRLEKAVRKFSIREPSTVPVGGTREVRSVGVAFNDMSAALSHQEMLRRRLIQDVSHELRTPLTVLSGNLRAILDDVYPLDKGEILRLYEQTRLLSRLVNDLYELAQADAKQLRITRGPVDVAQLIDETVSAFRPIAETEQIQ
ncbi:MAG: histidine kinase dimerization/phospho-acceptor domain-containing protein, partial [Chloroflexota bacterium]